MTSTVVYVSNAASGDITVLRVAADATAAEQLQRLFLGGAIMPMAFSPDHHRLYAVRRTEPFSVHTLAVDAATGALEAVGEAPLADNMAYVSTARDGRFLFTASYENHRVAVNEIDTNGVVGATVQTLTTPRHAHAIRPDPSGRSVWVSCLGADLLLQHAFDPASGHLSGAPVAGVPCRAGSGPRHFVFHPHAPWLFIVNELDGTIDTLAPGDGAPGWQAVHSMATLPAGCAATPRTAELRLSADGRRLFSSDRGSSTIASFEVDTSTGRLSLLDHVEAEAQPRSFALSPDGRLLFAAGQASDHLGVYGIDPASGRLRALSRHPVGRSPTWVEAMALSRGQALD